MRTALRATRFRVVLPFFAATLVLAAAGAAIGTGIAYAGVTMFDRATQDVGKPYYMEFALDLPVLLFVVGVTVFTALLAGAAPAFHVLRTDVNATLKDESRGSSGVLGGRLTRILVTAEIALSCALLIGAGLMVKSIVKLRNFEYPYTPEHIRTARVGLFETEYPDAEALGGALGPYALQAAIAACHARAPTPAETDWARIAALYDALVQLAPSPVVDLNRAVAVAMVFGPAAGLELVDALTSEPSLKNYHLLPSVRGDLLTKLSRFDEARAELERAASLTRNTRERTLLLERAAACARLLARPQLPEAK